VSRTNKIFNLGDTVRLTKNAYEDMSKYAFLYGYMDLGKVIDNSNDEYTAVMFGKNPKNCWNIYNKSLELYNKLEE